MSMRQWFSPWFLFLNASDKTEKSTHIDCQNLPTVCSYIFVVLILTLPSDPHCLIWKATTTHWTSKGNGEWSFTGYNIITVWTSNEVAGMLTLAAIILYITSGRLLPLVWDFMLVFIQQKSEKQFESWYLLFISKAAASQLWAHFIKPFGTVEPEYLDVFGQNAVAWWWNMLNKWILTLLEDFAFGAINYTVCTEIEMTIAEELWVSPHYCCMNSAQPVQSSRTFFRWHLEDECKQSNRLWKPIINPRYRGRHNYVIGKLFYPTALKTLQLRLSFAI